MFLEALFSQFSYIPLILFFLPSTFLLYSTLPLIVRLPFFSFLLVFVIVKALSRVTVVLSLAMTSFKWW